MAAKQKKPVVISMGDVAASGGYYIAAGASKIMAQPSTITGSIGVVGGKPVIKGFYDWMGVTNEYILRGKKAGMFRETEKFTPDERASLKNGQDNLLRRLRAESCQRPQQGRRIYRLGWPGPSLDRSRRAKSADWSTSLAVWTGRWKLPKRLAKIPDGQRRASRDSSLPAHASCRSCSAATMKTASLSAGETTASDSGSDA